ncbi:hypothetical protein KFK09_002778 [Dendrobium nobile]|uniref:Epidermal patterning factor-like protein n=1 Tax=Dendrobium nobile TaxID=94219 RepID=A0A8T3C4S6_DENNO|nr:hypothetical protein KFK09_002778 [Dendrobium nobile]
MLLHSFTISILRTFLLFISILILLPASTQESVFTNQGRSLEIHKELSKEERSEGMLPVNSMIGSRPPRCERRCPACSHCEPVQVPATSQQRSASVHSFMINNAKDDDSNYKPMSWKCKCGSLIFNP